MNTCYSFDGAYRLNTYSVKTSTSGIDYFVLYLEDYSTPDCSGLPYETIPEEYLSPSECSSNPDGFYGSIMTGLPTTGGDSEAGLWL